ncbi:MAG TPA: FkbM family methyltransferase, partial [Planctomycetaceae bacterium]|nr:FkbM family methyltransferase [Planctomycetaceae bacterium]
SGSGSQVSSGTRFVNRMLYYLTDTLSKSPAMGEFTLRVGGTERLIRFNARNRQFNSLYFEKYNAGYELDVTSAIVQYLPRDGVFYDIGSNWGYFSMLVATLDDFAGKVHAFEPWPSSYGDLTSTVNQAELNSVIECHNLALSDRPGEAVMESGRHSGLAHLVDSGSGPCVRVSVLDQMKIDPPDLMKIDAEGAELSILRGGAETIARSRPFVVFENSFKDQDFAALEVLGYLESIDYRLFVPMLEYRLPDETTILASGHDPVPKGAVLLRMRLVPLSRQTRLAFREYINLLAAPREKQDRWGGDVVE